MAGIRDKHRRTWIGLFTGEEFILRKIRASEFMSKLGMLPADNTATLSEQLSALGERLKEKAKDPVEGEDITRFYLERGVRSPKIFFGPYDECPEDHIHYEDLSDDANGLVQAIAEYSFDFDGFKKKMEDILRELQPVPAGPGGEAVQQAANGTSPQGHDS